MTNTTPTPPLPPDMQPHPARRLFSKVGIALLALLIIGSFFATAFYARHLIQSGQMAAVISSTLVRLTNADRVQERLEGLTVNPLLVEAAQMKAQDMALKGYFAHETPEGYAPWHWFTLAGYEFSHAGENLAVNFSDSEDVERAWMESPGHRANILNERFTEIGIATAVGEYRGKQVVFVVQMFGTPKASALSLLPETAVAVENPESDVAATEEVPVADVDSVEALANAPEVASVAVFDYFATSPHTLLRTIYIISALVIISALLLLTRFELAHHHVRHVLAACALLMLMSGLFYVADRLVFTEPILTFTAPLEAGG